LKYSWAGLGNRGNFDRVCCAKDFPPQTTVM
jgi:hypothetical protein